MSISDIAARKRVSGRHLNTAILDISILGALLLFQTKQNFIVIANLGSAHKLTPHLLRSLPPLRLLQVRPPALVP